VKDDQVLFDSYFKHTLKRESRVVHSPCI
jgi:hypothetical protein